MLEQVSSFVEFNVFEYDFSLEIILNVIDHNMNIQEASNATRVHHQWYPDEIRVEKGISADIRENLRKKGHLVKINFSMGSTQSILFKNNQLHGASDPRRMGSLAVGY